MSNPDVITKYNFGSINEYFRTDVFSNINTDKTVKDISRVHFLPYDVDVYSDFNTEIEIPKHIYSKVDIVKNNGNKKGTVSCININLPSCNTTNCTLPVFIDIHVLFNKFKTKTQIEYTSKERAMLLVDEDGNGIDTTKAFMRKNIPVTRRHKELRAFMQHMLDINYNTVGVSLLELQSLINYFNKYNCDSPLPQREMLRTVQREYDKFLRGEGYVTRRTKYAMANPSLPPDERQRAGSQMYQTYRKQKSIKIIGIAIELITAQGKKVTVKNVAEALKGKLSLHTIKTHWKVFKPTITNKVSLPALPDTQVENILKHTQMEKQSPVVPPKMAHNPVEVINTEAPKELKKPEERLLSAEAIDMGFKDLDYYIKTWERVLGQETAYMMYEEQFKKMVHPVKAMNYLKAV